MPLTPRPCSKNFGPLAPKPTEGMLPMFYGAPADMLSVLDMLVTDLIMVARSIKMCFFFNEQNSEIGFEKSSPNST